jgi:5'-nucleotidase (lipoprotein e(P4) family)
MKKILLIILPAIIICSCCTETGKKTSKADFEKGKLNEYDLAATLYNQLSGEYHALALQAFHLAKLRVEEKLSAYKHKPDSLAIVVDLDETILNNSAFQAQLIKDDSTYFQEWSEYIKSIKAKAVPGALDFLKYVNEQKIRIFYITNRDSTEFESTARNLARLHFPQIDTIDFKRDYNLQVERVITDGKQAGNKEFRFENVRKRYVVLIQMGDNLNDFSGKFYHQTDGTRDSLVEAEDTAFGKDYIVLPNAMYGDWLSGLTKQNFNAMSTHMQDSIMHACLKGYK